MLDSERLEKAKLVQQGMQQFDTRHSPVEQDGSLYCGQCETDYPCERMLSFMLLQAIATMQAMIPSGNMANVMQRFMNGGKQ